MGALEKVFHDIVPSTGHEAKMTPMLWDSRIILCPVMDVEHTITP
jgi:hypothetical protein